MEPSPLHFVSHTHYYRGGDVVVDQSAAIAPGVVLRAAPSGAIHIGPGVCIGAGVVIQAKQGCIYVEAGVSLGTGVLIVGHGHVGKNACVGPASTLINPAIAPNTILAPCSLIEASATQPMGEESRVSQPSSFQAPGFQVGHDPVPSMPMPPRTSPTVKPQAVSPKAVNTPTVEPTVPSEAVGDNTSSMTAPSHYVYGREHLNNLLSALFPHRQPLDNGGSSDQSGKAT